MQEAGKLPRNRLQRVYQRRGPNRFSLKSRGRGSPQAKLYQPSIDLSEGVLLPLIRSALAECVGTFHELPHAGRAEII